MTVCKRVFTLAALGSALVVGYADSDYQQALPAVPTHAGASNASLASGAQAANSSAQFAQGLKEIQSTSSMPSLVSHSAAPDSQIAVMMAKLMQLNQELMHYQDNMDQQFQTLSQTTSQLTDRLNQVAGAVQSVNQQAELIAGLRTDLNQLKQQLAANNHRGLLSLLKGGLGANLFYALMAVLFFLLLVIARLAWPSKPKAPVASRKAVDDEQADYDYMATPDAMPVKLDLARAYIAMGDKEQANKVLAEVTHHGNSDQKKQANELIEQLENIEHA